MIKVIFPNEWEVKEFNDQFGTDLKNEEVVSLDDTFSDNKDYGIIYAIEWYNRSYDGSVYYEVVDQ